MEIRLVAFAIILAFWPLVSWYSQRILDPSSPAWGLLPLLVLLWASFRKPEGESAPQRVDYLIPLTGLVLYTSTYIWAPTLVSAALAVFTIVSLASQKRFGRPIHLGVLGLGLLALPILPSLQFYIGYPLRVLVAKGAALLLRWNGLLVSPEGAGLKWAEKTVLVDAPCSGINMLWVALFVACFLAIYEKYSNPQTAAFLMMTTLATIFANIVRASTLFYLETEIIEAPVWAHTAVGTMNLCLLIAGLALLSKSIKAKSESSYLSAERGKQIFLAACLMAASVPLLASAPTVTYQSSDFPGWPTTFEGRHLQQLELRPDEIQFYRANFPGKAGRFSDGQREIILRWVTQPTRALHPAADCFRGLGYDVGKPSVAGSFRTFTVSKDELQLSVREQITDSDNNNWTDVSAWYWAAVLGRSQGPYWVVVVAERLSP